MKFLIFFIHLLFDYLLGVGVLSFLKNERLLFGHSFIALLLGFFLETMLTFIVLWSGGSLQIAIPIVVGLMLLVNMKHLLKFFKSPVKFKSLVKEMSVKIHSVSRIRFKWYNYALLALIIQKIAMIVWQLYRMPTFHSDTLKHWSTQARALYAQVNFSMLPNTYEFLARKLQVVLEYPLQLPIWRATSAFIGGEWNEFVSRSDGLLFFIIICGIVGSTMWMLTNKKWIALGAVYIVASLPLQVWHGASGYADIAVEAYVVAAVACFIGKEWFLCGIFMAGTVWSKNDGLALYLPGILAGGFVYHIFLKDTLFFDRIKKMSEFVLGFSLVLPWLIFQGLHSHSVFSKIITQVKNLFSYQHYDPNNFEIILTQVGKKFQNSPPSYELFWEHVFLGSTFGIFWIAIFLGIFFFLKRLAFDTIGRSLLIYFMITCSIIYYVFTYTPAYEFLLIQTTVHRTLLQFAPSALLVIGYGIHLELKVLKDSRR